MASRIWKQPLSFEDSMKTRIYHSTYHSTAIAGLGRKCLLAVLIASVCSVLSVPAQAPPPGSAQQNEPALLSMQELRELLKPIALYPDALIALILPASTVPSDITLGARHVRENGDPNAVDNQPWDESVKSLARYPDVLKWMDDNLEWTAAVGEAFVEQPADVMNAVQELRSEARTAGNLVDTPEQKVVVEQENIRIVPANPQVIYVPQYDPEIVYVRPYAPDLGPLLTFGAGFAVGWWLNYDFDWGRRSFYRGNWRGWDDWDGGGWRGGRGGNETVNVVNITNVNQWQPSENSRREILRRQRENLGNARFVRARSMDAAAPADRAAQRAVNVPRPGRINVAQDSDPGKRPRAAGENATERKARQAAAQPDRVPKATADAPKAPRDAARPEKRAATTTARQDDAATAQKKPRPTTAAPKVDQRPATADVKRDQPRQPTKAPDLRKQKQQAKRSAAEETQRAPTQSVKPDKPAPKKQPQEKPAAQRQQEKKPAARQQQQEKPTAQRQQQEKPAQKAKQSAQKEKPRPASAPAAQQSKKEGSGADAQKAAAAKKAAAKKKAAEDEKKKNN
jgi:hypothetical protein